MIQQTTSPRHAVPQTRVVELGLVLAAVLLLGQSERIVAEEGLPSGTVVCLSVRRTPWGLYSVGPDSTFVPPARPSFEVFAGDCSQCAAHVSPGRGDVRFAEGVEADAEARQSLRDAAGSLASRPASLSPWVVPPDFPAGWDVTMSDSADGATVEGPSSGMAYAVAILSALNTQPIAADRAFTGAVDASGRAGPVGGIIAKLQAAEVAGIGLAIVPGEPEAASPRLGLQLRAIARRGRVRVAFVGSVPEAAFHAFGPEAAYDRAFTAAHRAIAEGDTSSAQAAFTEMERCRPGDTTAATWDAILTVGATVDAVERGRPADALRILGGFHPRAGLPAGWADAVAGCRRLLSAIDAALADDFATAAAEISAASRACPHDPDIGAWAALIRSCRNASEAAAPKLPQPEPIGQWAARCLVRAEEDRAETHRGRRVIPLTVRIEEALAADGMDDALVTVLTACDLIEAQTGVRVSPRVVSVGLAESGPTGGRELVLEACPGQPTSWADVLTAAHGLSTRVRVPEGYDRPVWYVMRALLLGLGAHEEQGRRCVMSGGPDDGPCLSLCPLTRAEVAAR